MNNICNLPATGRKRGKSPSSSTKSNHKKSKCGNSKYIELQTFTNFSFLRGASHPEEIIKTAADLGYQKIAITDYQTLSGIVRAHTAAKAQGVSIIVGTMISLYSSLDARTQKKPQDHLETRSEELPAQRLPVSILLYPSNREAYARLCRLLTTGKRRAYKGNCIITLEDLAKHSQGLFATVLIHSFQHKELLQILGQLQQIFHSDRLSLAIYRTYGPDEHQRLDRLKDISSLQNIPLVAQNAVHFHSAKRKPLHDVMTCIRRGVTLSEAGLHLFQNAERHLKSANEMARLFRHLPCAVARSAEIAAIVSQFSLDDLRYEYPHEVCPKEISPQNYLEKLTWEHANKHYSNNISAKVAAQLHHELQLIAELEYAKYFLTVYDIVSFAKQRNILCQGRGAAANSVVCFVLGITSVNPDNINLLFERFVSKERNEPPDIDIDFEHERREEVIQYIYQKYGRDRAALTAAITTYRTKSAVRDVGKVFGLGDETICQIQKVISRDPAPYTDEVLLDRNLDPKNQAIQFTLTLSQQLKGFPRHLTQHVGGFVISEQALCEIVPIENAAMPDRTVIEWDKNDLEAMGMLKIDILALGMLSCIRKALSYVNKKESSSLSLYNIPAQDPEVYEMICRADTIGVFQIESRAQMSMLPRLRPKCFYDLVIEVAIVRPGPIQGGMVHPYLRRRHGLEPVSYPSETVKNILAPTLGVPIFQEQVMQLAIHAAGFSAGQADQLRRAMASWKRSENALGQFEQRLLSGMNKNGYSLSFARQVFKQILGFGEYGFPQSHAASFAHLVYASCWLKHHKPAQFCAALLNSQPMGYYRPAQLIEDAKKHGVEILPVDIIKSNWDTEVIYPQENSNEKKQPSLRLGLRCVKGVSRSEMLKIVSTRKSLTTSSPSIQTIWRVCGVQVASLQKLAAADAFGSLSLNRQQALWQIRKLSNKPLPLFDSLPNTPDIAIESLPELSKKAHVVRDYQNTGFSLKAHPLHFLRRKLASMGVRRNQDLGDPLDAAHGVLWSSAGMVLVRQRPMTASGVVFMTLEDETAVINVIIRPKVFEEFRNIICDSTLLLVCGRLQREVDVVHLLLTEAQDISAWFYQLPEEASGWKSRDFR